MTRISFACLLSFLGLAAACGGRGSEPAASCAGSTGVAGAREMMIVSGDRERSFRLVVPESALHGEPVPLLVLFHGSNGDGAKEIAVTGFDRSAVEEGFIVAAGNGTQRSWNTGFCRDPDGSACVEDVDDVLFTRDMIAAVAGEYCIDAERIYATGFSKGAAMVFRLACEASDLFAAFAPVAGALVTSPCEPEEPRPILIVNNLADAAAPVAAGEASFESFLARNACTEVRRASEPASNAACEIAPDCVAGAATEFCRVEGGHRWPGGATEPDGPLRATDLVWQFFAGR